MSIKIIQLILDVSYDERETAKQSKCIWNKELKKWVFELDIVQVYCEDIYHILPPFKVIDIGGEITMTDKAFLIHKIETWKQQRKKDQKGKPKCLKCGLSLVPIGTSRKRGKQHLDWHNREYHKKCWKEWDYWRESECDKTIIEHFELKQLDAEFEAKFGTR